MWEVEHKGRGGSEEEGKQDRKVLSTQSCSHVTLSHKHFKLHRVHNHVLMHPEVPIVKQNNRVTSY